MNKTILIAAILAAPALAGPILDVELPPVEPEPPTSHELPPRDFTIDELLRELDLTAE